MYLKSSIRLCEMGGVCVSVMARLPFKISFIKLPTNDKKATLETAFRCPWLSVILVKKHKKRPKIEQEVNNYVK